MVEILETRLKEFEKNKTFSEIDSNKKSLYFNSIRDIFKKVGGYFNIKQEDFFKEIGKREIVFPRQLCQYRITKENKKIFEGREYWSLTAGLFKQSHSVVIHNYSGIEESKELPTFEGKIIREVLGLFLAGSLENLEQSELMAKLNSKERKKFSAIVNNVCEKISGYFHIDKQDLFKNKNSLETQLCFYKISEGNKKIFGHENSSLTASLFNTNYESVLYGYYRTDTWKYQDDLDGKIIREVLSLFR